MYLCPQIDQNQSSRDAINAKFEKVDVKINSMLETQSIVMSLRKDLNRVENVLFNLNQRVEKIGAVLSIADSTTPSMASALIRGF